MRLISLTAAVAVLSGLVSAAGYSDPRSDGGSMLTSWPAVEGNHEPLNVILSGDSDPIVLRDSLWKGGFRRYMLSGNMAREFLGLHQGTHQQANLGDGQGVVDEIRVLRHDYGKPIIGTGIESLVGGNHLRYWTQSSTGAYFMAVSAEHDVSQHHAIIPDGYNRGRDMFISELVGQQIDTATVKAGDKFEGTSRHVGWKYKTTVEYVEGLLEKTSDGINHAEEVGNGGPAIDGLVAVITVSIERKGLL